MVSCGRRPALRLRRIPLGRGHIWTRERCLELAYNSDAGRPPITSKMDPVCHDKLTALGNGLPTTETPRYTCRFRVLGWSTKNWSIEVFLSFGSVFAMKCARQDDYPSKVSCSVSWPRSLSGRSAQALFPPHRIRPSTISRRSTNKGSLRRCQHHSHCDRGGFPSALYWLIAGYRMQGSGTSSFPRHLHLGPHRQHL